MDPKTSAHTFTDLSPAPEKRDQAIVPNQIRNLIDGNFTAGRGTPMDVTDPATGKKLTHFRTTTKKDIDKAVAAARAAQPAWAATAPIERGKALFRLSRRLAERARALAVTESLDGGKPIRESRDVDIPLAISHIFHHAGWADKLQYANLGPNPQPIGVAAQIIPWNFPLLMAAWKIAPALACGNTVILKPAETTPLTAHALAHAATEAGIPPGVLNVVFGDGTTGQALALHPDVNKVAFTGSTAVGKMLATNLAGTRRHLTLELGGKGANIVFDDSDLDAAVEGIVAGIFYNQGHVCCAGSRLVVQESVHDELLERLAARISRIKVGDPLDKNTDLGAINSTTQHARITTMVNDAIQSGAEMLDVHCPTPDPRFFIPPTVLTGVHPSMPIAREEIFGPVLTVLPFRTPQEALDIANTTPFGLASGVWTQSPERAAWTAQRLQTGVVWINTYNRFNPTAAFGGFKESGFGREGGRAGLEAYCA